MTEERVRLKVVIQFISGRRLESEATDVSTSTYSHLRLTVGRGMNLEASSLSLTGLSFDGQVSGTLALNPRKIEYIQLVLPDLTSDDVER